MSANHVAASVAALVSRDVTARVTGTTPDIIGLEAIAHKSIPHKNLITMADGSRRSMLYSGIIQNAHSDMSASAVQDIIESDIMLMDTYQALMWEEAKRTSALRADLHQLSDTIAAVTAELQPIVNRDLTSMDVPDVQVIDNPAFDSTGDLGIIHDSASNMDEDVLLSKARLYASTAKSKFARAEIDPILLASLNSLTGTSVDFSKLIDATNRHYATMTKSSIDHEHESFATTLELLTCYNDLRGYDVALRSASDDLEQHIGYQSLLGVVTDLSNSLYHVLAMRMRYIMRTVHGGPPVMSGVYSKNGAYYAYKLSGQHVDADTLRNYARVTRTNPTGIYTVSLQELDRVAQKGQADRIAFDFKSKQEGVKALRAAVESAVYQLSKTHLNEYTEEQVGSIMNRISNAVPALVENTVALDSVVTSALAATGKFSASIYLDISNKVNFAMESAAQGSATMTQTDIATTGKDAIANAFAQMLCAKIAPNF